MQGVGGGRLLRWLRFYIARTLHDFRDPSTRIGEEIAAIVFEHRAAIEGGMFVIEGRT